MKELQIDSLRDFAIDHLPRAQAIREQAKRFGISHVDFYNLLAHTSVSIRAHSSTSAVEFVAANVLEIVCLLRAEREDPLPKATRLALLQRLINHAKELCVLTERSISWLDDLPGIPEPEPEPDGEQQARPVRQPALPVAGRTLTTKEAAEALGMEAQTLLKWASTQTGPIQPCGKVGRHHRWSGDEISAHLMSKRAK